MNVRQLGLPGIRRASIVRAELPLENEVQTTLVKLLVRYGIDPITWDHSSKGLLLDPKQGGALKRMGQQAGAPDLYIWKPGRPTLGLEIKRNGGAQSDAQHQFEKQFIATGQWYVLVRGLPQAVRFLIDQGYLRPEAGGGIL